MKKTTIENYRISGNKVTHMKLTKISLSDNETLSMYNRYRFDEESTRKMLEDSQRMSEEYDLKKEQKEYEEKNYDAICRRMSKLSNLELLKELFSTIRHINDK